MSTSVPLWVPIVVAVLGFAGVISAQLIAGWREDRRWRRELEREELRWERERDKRSYDARAAAYAELVGAIESFDWVLFLARHELRAGRKVDEQAKEDIRAASAEARKSLGMVNVHAPERIRAMLSASLLRRSSLANFILRETYEAAKDTLWEEGQREYRALRAAIREDLGLDAEELPA
ncbi:hypothetical protein AB5J62_27380 [Amycolatopsis sp. cg5]|uniref:hypothetical protein n=1 Tax=Amycolatopsis sp. cg5 TaxID=3238802 RepID=UPI0035251B5A